MDAIKLNAELIPQGYIAVRVEVIPPGVPSARAEGSAHLAIMRTTEAGASPELRVAVLEAIFAVGARHNADVGKAYEAGTGVD